MTKKISEEWKWNPKLMLDDDTKAELRNSPLATAEMIHNVILTLIPLQINLGDGTMSWFSALCLTKDMWDATNYARLWPEANHQATDSLLQDAMSHIAEAHYMVESMFAWDKFTIPALTNVSNELLTGIGFLRKAYVEVEIYLATCAEGDDNGHVKS